MVRCSTTLARLWAPLMVCAGTVAQADQPAILAGLRTFFETASGEQRQEIVRQLKSDSAYDRTRISAWLHDAGLFEPLSAGRRRIRVPIDDGSTLRVTLRIPNAYDHRRPYPLLYVLHGRNGTGDGIIRYAEQLLGDEVEQYVVAAPTGYRQVVIHSTTPPSTEHLAALLAIRKNTHIDSDRVFAMGYSQGGHAAWTLAVHHPDQFAGVVAVAGTLTLPDYGELLETFLPNIAATRVFACWGENDVLGADRKTPSESGGIAGLNCRLCRLAAGLELPLTWYEVPNQGHGGVEPPRRDLDTLLAATREHYPRSIRHVFRLPYQGQTAWIEAHAWRGPWWDNRPLTIRYHQGENPDDPEVQRAALARTIRGRLGELRGEIDGQNIRVYRKKISELTVWIGDGMIDWDQPVSLNVNGRDAFEGTLTPDLFVCLTQVARTYDFDRLRWAGLRFKSGSKTRIVTGDTQFPAPPITPE